MSHQMQNQFHEYSNIKRLNISNISHDMFINRKIQINICYICMILYMKNLSNTFIEIEINQFYFCNFQINKFLFISVMFLKKLRYTYYKIHIIDDFILNFKTTYKRNDELYQLFFFLNQKSASKIFRLKFQFHPPHEQQI